MLSQLFVLMLAMRTKTFYVQHNGCNMLKGTFLVLEIGHHLVCHSLTKLHHMMVQ